MGRILHHREKADRTARTDSPGDSVRIRKPAKGESRPGTVPERP